jgi:hypothetical protein
MCRCEEEGAALVLHPLVCAAMGGDPGDLRETVCLLRKDAENTYGIMAPCTGQVRALPYVIINGITIAIIMNVI